MNRIVLLAFAALIVVACHRLDPIGGPACTTVADCSADQTCSDGHCLDNSSEGEGEGAGEGEGEGAQCTTDAECGRDQVCSGGVCVPVNGSGGCHNDGECSDGASCVSPDAPPQCGNQPVPIDSDCADNSGCSNGDVCDFVDDGCGQHHLACVAPCGTDPSCTPGTQCDCAANQVCNSGRCEAFSCVDGFACPSWTFCSGTTPDPLTDDSHHGCTTTSCAIDQDCPTPFGGFVAIIAQGFCVQGQCASGPGSCQLPVP